MNRKTKKSLSILMSAMMVVSLFTGSAWKENAVKAANAANEPKAADYGIANPITKDGTTTWDTIYFGNYYQSDTNGDGKADESDTKEPIRWRVLSVDGDDAFLLADKCLDCQPYNKEYEGVTWETCSLRKWLNEEFYREAFSSEEQAAVEETTVENHNNPYYGTEGGSDTKDKVYLLSLEEIVNTKYGFSKYVSKETETRQAEATEYAKENGVYTPEEGSHAGKTYWWCRSIGINRMKASHVYDSGEGDYSGVIVDFARKAVRPVFHLDLSIGSFWKKGEKVSARSVEEEEILEITPEATANPIYGLNAPVVDKNRTTWDTIYFGNYYQSNSETKEPICWRVLTVNGDDAFLLADKCLDCQEYNMKSKNVTWEICTLRNWLNQDFYQEAFNSAEQAAIKEIVVENHNNPYDGTKGGNDTKDKVYLLSLEEIINIKYGFSKYIYKSSETRQAEATEYAKVKGVYTPEEGSYAGKAYWWCRSAGYFSTYACIDHSGGWRDAVSDMHNIGSIAVRPALHLNLSSTSLWEKGEKVSAGEADTEPKPTATPEPQVTLAPVITNAPQTTPTATAPSQTPNTQNTQQNSTAKGAKLVTKSGKTYITVDGKILKGKKQVVTVNKKSYIVDKKGAVIKGKKNKLVKVGKKYYIVDKKGVVYKNKKKIKVGKKYYKVNKKGVATQIKKKK